MNTSRMTLCAGLTLIPQSLKDWLSTGTIFSFPSGFDETDKVFLEFTEDQDNIVRGSSSVGDNSGTSQPSMSSKATVTGTSKSTATPMRLVSTHHTHWRDEQSPINKAIRQKQPYNHSNRSKSFLQ
ncbi:hypothetical protein E5676_scaffold287G00360 [Cucumis melo var. makuwa]|uniref:CACTA en-spm transposon protein n=1 Tax=Cucumis melo var. makuwa TaxID=1194695 RepID=A0A5D3C4M1_CUCMM|nr:hypothetical protein E5676_scaffold287G00360 [Cucumis melo var. makuwa]